MGAGYRYAGPLIGASGPADCQSHSEPGEGKDMARETERVRSWRLVRLSDCGAYSPHKSPTSAATSRPKTRLWCGLVSILED